MDAAVATAFALAVTWPPAGNLGGGGFLVWRSAGGEAAASTFVRPRPRAPADMFLRDGKYDAERHYRSHLSVGVPGSVAGLHLAWKENGRLPWKRLVEPAVALARDGFPVDDGLARSLKRELPALSKHPASRAQFSKDGAPYETGRAEAARPRPHPPTHRGRRPGGVLRRGDAEHRGGHARGRRPRHRAALRRLLGPAPRALRGTYRGHEVLTMPPPSSGGIALLEMLNILEGYDLKATGFGRPRHRPPRGRGHAPRLRRPRPLPRRSRVRPRCRWPASISKEYAAALRRTIREGQRLAGRPRRASTGRGRAARRPTSPWWTRTGTRCR